MALLWSRADGSLDRKALAELAFEHNRADALNHIVHPAVIAAEEEWMRGVFAADPKRVAIVESALIFEVEKWGTAPGWVQRFDKLILVTVPDEVKIARFVSRLMAKETGEADRESRITMLTRDARARMAAQIPDQEKAGRCDYVIDNTGSVDETRTVVEEIYRELVQAALDLLPNHFPSQLLLMTRNGELESATAPLKQKEGEGLKGPPHPSWLMQREAKRDDRSSNGNDLIVIQLCYEDSHPPS